MFSIRTLQNTNDMQTFKTIQKARTDLVGEINAIIEYEDHISSTNNMIAKQTWSIIVQDELSHVGELLALLNYLDPTQKEYVLQGYQSFQDRLKNK